MDELQRRLRAADPLSADGAAVPEPARLDARIERILTSDGRPSGVVTAIRRGRPRAIPAGLGALGVVAIAAAVMTGQLARPAPILAFDGVPSPVSETQRAAAVAACGEGLEGAWSDPSVRGRLDPPVPVALPPLAALELHGTGGVAVFADDASVAVCMLLADGDGWVRGPVVLDLPRAAGESLSGVPSVFGTEFAGTSITVIGGTAPEGAATMRLEGGPADGATATVTQDGYGIWVPGDYHPAPELVALDASGREISRISLEVQKGPAEGPLPSPTR